MIWPVGVGFTSRGPIGALGLTMTTGRPSRANSRGHLFRLPFRALVMIAHLRPADRRRFVRRRQFAVDLRAASRCNRPCWYRQCAGNPPPRRLQNIPRALDIGRVHRAIIAQPEMVTGRNVKAPIAAAHRLFQQRAVGNIALDPFAIHPGQPAQFAARPHKHLHPVVPRPQLTHQIGADKPRRACNKTIHCRSNCLKIRPAMHSSFTAKFFKKSSTSAKTLMNKWLRLYAEKS